MVWVSDFGDVSFHTWGCKGAGGVQPVPGGATGSSGSLR